MNTQTTQKQGGFSKDQLKTLLLEQKSLIALLVLIAVVSSMSPNSLRSITSSTFCSKHRSTPLWRWG